MRRVFVMLGHFQFNWLLSLCTQVAFSSIQFTHESKYMHGCRYALNGTEATLDGSQCLDFMYGQTLGWSYVNTPGNYRKNINVHQTRRLWVRWRTKVQAQAWTHYTDYPPSIPSHHNALRKMSFCSFHVQNFSALISQTEHRIFFARAG